MFPPRRAKDGTILLEIRSFRQGTPAASTSDLWAVADGLRKLQRTGRPFVGSASARLTVTSGTPPTESRIPLNQIP